MAAIPYPVKIPAAYCINTDNATNTDKWIAASILGGLFILIIAGILYERFR